MGGTGAAGKKRNRVSGGYLIAAAALVALGGGWRILHLNDAVRYDEAFTFLEYGVGPLATALTDYSAPNNHPLNTCCIHAAGAVGGADLPACRVIPLGAGLGLLVLIAALAYRVFGRVAGLVALAVAAASPLLAHYSVLARGYSLYLFWGLAALYLIEIRPAGKRGGLAALGLAVSLALACFAVPAALLLITPLLAYDVYLARRLRRPAAPLLGAWTGAAALTAIAYAPLWYPDPGGFFATAGGLPGTGGDVWVYVRALGDDRTWGLGGPGVWVPAAAAAFVITGWYVKRFRVLAAAAGAGAIAFLAAGYRPPNRVFLYFLPLVALAAGGAAQLLWTHWKGRRWSPRLGAVVLVAATAAVIAGAEFNQYLERADRAGSAPGAAALAEYLARQDPGSARVIANAPINYPLQYYLGGVKSGAAAVVVRPPAHAFTYEAWVVVPAGSSVEAEVRTRAGPRARLARGELTAAGADVALWKTVIADVNP